MDLELPIMIICGESTQETTLLSSVVDLVQIMALGGLTEATSISVNVVKVMSTSNRYKISI